MEPITIRVSRRRLRAWKLLVVGILILAAALFAGGRLRPILTTVFTYQAKLAATRSINDAILDVVAEGSTKYGAIIHIQKDASGRATYLETDMVAMNRLKAEIGNAVADRLAQNAKQEVRVPLGTLFGGVFFTGRGPQLSFRVMPAGYAETDFYNEFHSAGINQTLHQVMVTVTVPVSAVLPLYTIVTEVTTSVCVAETVIVGEVPRSYTDITGDSRGLLDKVNDYSAAKK